MSEDSTERDMRDLLGRLLERHGRALELFARQYCDSPEDVVQYALLKLVQQKKRPDRVLPWLYKVVRNRAISVSRSASRRRRRERTASQNEREWFEPSYGEQLDAQAAARALGSLTDGQREAIVARIWGGLTYEEIGEAVGCSSSAAHRRYTAGMEVLRERLGTECSSKKQTDD
ncbi:MAG: sigma-70 family RNA polymerase sigma factor [Candidatus Brocadiaceae bacterium]|jgi:RNA polymerase sigma-70 factor (ECF subfamily)